MALKFDRNYTLSIQGGLSGDWLDINYPITCEFMVKKHNMAPLNEASFKLYNLKLDTRNLIYHELYATNTRRQIIFNAGYGDASNLVKIFDGTVKQCYSYRQGKDIITEIFAWDGGDATNNGVASVTVDKNESFKDLLYRLSGYMPNLTGTYVSDSFSNFIAKRGQAYIGEPYGLITSFASTKTFIEDRWLYVLNKERADGKTEVFEPGLIATIDFNDGLLDTPKRNDTQLIFKMIFTPGLETQQWVKLNSLVNPIYNNESYEVTGFTHQGIISGSVAGGECTTTVYLNFMASGYSIGKR